MKTRWIPFLTALAVTLASPGLAADPKEKKPDPKAGELTYQGSGYAERAPDYAEVAFSFTVTNQNSAEEVIAALEAVSNPVWRAIAAHVGGKRTETTQAYWGDIANIRESEGSSLQIVRPTEGDNARAGSAKRIDNRTGKEIGLEETRPPVFSGSQMFSFRSADMSFLEGLVRGVNETEQKDDADAVKVSVSAVQYKVTVATLRKMLADVKEQARQQATGPNSKFANDSVNFGIESAHFIDASPSYPARYEPQVRGAGAPGERPKLTLTLPYTMVFYAEGKDLIKKKGGTTEPISLTYEVPGTAAVDADYGVVTVTVHSGYHKTKNAASTAVNAEAEKVLARLRREQGDKAPSETDRVVDEEATAPDQVRSYQPVAWNGIQPTRYLNTITGEIVDAPEGGESRLPALWQARRTLRLRSSNFATIGALQSALTRELGKARAKVGDVKVTVSDVVPSATEATKQEVARLARQSATACIVDPKGPVALDAKLHGFKCAHLKEIVEGPPMMIGTRGAAKMALGGHPEAALVAPQSADDALEVTPVKRDNSERPVFPMERHFTFRYRIVTQNLAKGCKAAVADAGAEAT